MATIVYLDADDEITTAASRIRSAGAPRLGLVIPFGSRVATSRINFRLLAREAVDAGRRLDIVAPDASARALAASAGLPVFSSVAEYEAAFEEGGLDAAAGGMAAEPGGTAPAGAETKPSPREPGRSLRGGSSRAAGGAAARSERASAGSTGQPAAAGRDTRPPEAGGIAAPGRSVGASAGRDIVAAPSGSRPGRRALVAGMVIVLALVLGLGGVAALTVLPSAEITVTPVMEAVAPVALTVRANTSATTVDPAGLVIPATSIEVPVTAQGDFTPTGVSVQQTTASGRVTFDSTNTVNAMPIPKGTRVSTLDGVVFSTTASITVPRATVSGSTITHGLASVSVVAMSPGPKGNVAAKAIDQVPSSLAALQISVSNNSPTTGGARNEYPKVTAADVTAAKDQLAKELQDQLPAAVSDPTLAPDGSTLFPGTAAMGDPVYTPDPAGLEGKVFKDGETAFTLQADATATVTAVDEAPLAGMGDSAIRAAVTPGWQIRADSIQVGVGDGTVGEDGTVSFSVTASALEHRPLDAASLKANVLGKTRAQAEAALAAYGEVDISLWPFWVTSVPTNADRVSLTVGAPIAPPPTATPGATPTPHATGTPPSTTTPQPSQTASASPAGSAQASSPPAESAPASSPVPSS
jgi:hypothetical protein